MSRSIQEMREYIAEIGALMYARHLTDAAGGNISVRMDDKILITPKQAGSLFQWNLKSDQVLIVDLEGNKLEGRGEPSREAKVHYRLLTQFYPDGTAVVHGHARNALVFCAYSLPMPSVLYTEDKFGELKVVEDFPAHSPELANVVAAGIVGQEARIRKQAAAVLAPRHGVFVIAKDLEAGYDAIERIDVNAYCVLMGKLLGKG